MNAIYNKYKDEKGHFTSNLRPDLRTGRSISCAVCNKHFYIHPSRIGKKKFCSINCYNKAKKGRPSPFKGKKHTPETIEQLRQSKLGHKQSQETRLKRSKSLLALKRRGNRAPGWRGGKIKDSKGYVLVYAPNHPRARYRNPTKTAKYIREHQLLAEKHLKRYLSNDERVHHINGNKSDNRPENLYLFVNEQKHRNFHYNPHPLKSNLL